MLVYNAEWLKALGNQNLRRLISDGLKIDRSFDGSICQIIPDHDQSEDAPPSIIAKAGSTKRDFRTPFASDALNVLNKLAYSTEEEQKWMKSRTDHPFSCPTFAIALAGWLQANYQDEQQLQIKEMFAGCDTSMWQRTAQELKSKRMIVTRQLLSMPRPKSVAGDNFVIRFEEEDAMKPMATLSPEERHDVVFISYGFDSAWYRSDRLVAYCKGLWFEQLYRLRVPHWHPRRRLVIEALEGKDVTLRGSDVAAISVETTWQECGSYVRKLKNLPVNARIFSYPGGLIEKVEELFQKQLNHNGAVIVGEVSEGHDASTLPAVNTWGLAMYRTLSLGFAVRALKASGYDAKLMTAYEFYNKNIEASHPITIPGGTNIFDRSSDFEAVLIVKRIVQ